MGCIKHFFSCLLSCVFMFSVTLPDVAAAGTENLEFRGTLIEPPPCNLSEAGTIKVNFVTGSVSKKWLRVFTVSPFL